MGHCASLRSVYWSALSSYRSSVSGASANVFRDMVKAEMFSSSEPSYSSVVLRRDCVAPSSFLTLPRYTLLMSDLNNHSRKQAELAALQPCWRAIGVAHGPSWPQIGFLLNTAWKRYVLQICRSFFVCLSPFRFSSAKVGDQYPTGCLHVVSHFYRSTHRNRW